MIIVHRLASRQEGILLTFMIIVKPHIDSNIPSTQAYGVFIPQLIGYMRVCGNYQQFVYRLTLMTTRFQRQGFYYLMLCRTFKKFLGTA